MNAAYIGGVVLSAVAAGLCSFNLTELIKAINALRLRLRFLIHETKRKLIVLQGDQLDGCATKQDLYDETSIQISTLQLMVYMSRRLQENEALSKTVMLAGLSLSFVCVLALGQPLLALLVAAAVFCTLKFLPAYLCAQEELQVREKALAELPNMIDIVALGMSAGISFDAALQLYCERSNHELARRAQQTLSQWQMGLITRERGLHTLAEFYQFEAFYTFAETVIEALKFGCPLSPALSEQSDKIRREHQSYVQEKIEKAPIKMLVPIGVFILPAMLLTIMGPLLASALLATN